MHIFKRYSIRILSPERDRPQAGQIEYTFCVEDVVKGTLTYEPADNVETCESM